MKINKSLAPLKAGSARTALTIGVANALVDGANAINAMRGDGEGIKVTHSDSNIVVDLGCPMPRDYSVSYSFPYYNAFSPVYGCLGSLVAPPEVTQCVNSISFSSENRVSADFVYHLQDTFPYLDENYTPAFFYDGKTGPPSVGPRPPNGFVLPSVINFPLTQPSPGIGYRDHPGGALTIGPFNKRMIIFSITQIRCDDMIIKSTDGGQETLLIQHPDFISANVPLFYLPKGSSMRFRNIETGGAYVWAAGVLGAKAVHCCPKEWRTALGI